MPVVRAKREHGGYGAHSFRSLRGAGCRSGPERGVRRIPFFSATPPPSLLGAITCDDPTDCCSQQRVFSRPFRNDAFWHSNLLLNRAVSLSARKVRACVNAPAGGEKRRNNSPQASAEGGGTWSPTVHADAAIPVGGRHIFGFLLIFDFWAMLRRREGTTHCN